jgi:hypothetical protein
MPTPTRRPRTPPDQPCSPSAFPPAARPRRRPLLQPHALPPASSSRASPPLASSHRASPPPTSSSHAPPPSASPPDAQGIRPETVGEAQGIQRYLRNRRSVALRLLSSQRDRMTGRGSSGGETAPLRWGIGDVDLAGRVREGK